MTIDDLSARLDGIEAAVNKLSVRVASIESAPKIPGWWETVYPWVTGKTAVAIYAAAAAALMSWLGGIGGTAKPAERPAMMKEAQP